MNKENYIPNDTNQVPLQGLGVTNSPFRACPDLSGGRGAVWFTHGMNLLLSRLTKQVKLKKIPYSSRNGFIRVAAVWYIPIRLSKKYRMKKRISYTT